MKNDYNNIILNYSMAYFQNHVFNCIITLYVRSFHEFVFVSTKHKVHMKVHKKSKLQLLKNIETCLPY